VPFVLSPRGMLVKDMIARKSPLAKSLWIALIERRNVERAASLHVTSPLEADELARFGWRLPRLTMVPNGVEHPADASSDISLDVAAATAGDAPIVLSLCRLSWKKGLDRLLRAFAHTAPGTLVIAGTDDEGLGESLLALAQELGIASRVRVLPRTIGGVDKEHLYRAARVFVAPSLSENFGNTVLEAMRRGVPVVTTPEVGAATIVRDAQAGIVTDGAALPLSAAILRFIRDADLARGMGAAGQQHAIAHYGWPRIAADMERLYESLIA
jgi:glycosyltransferase involved in cell wall biosynthesis